MSEVYTGSIPPLFCPQELKQACLASPAAEPNHEPQAFTASSNLGSQHAQHIDASSPQTSVPFGVTASQRHKHRHRRPSNRLKEHVHGDSSACSSPEAVAGASAGVVGNRAHSFTHGSRVSFDIYSEARPKSFTLGQLRRHQQHHQLGSRCPGKCCPHCSASSSHQSHHISTCGGSSRCSSSSNSAACCRHHKHQASLSQGAASACQAGTNRHRQSANRSPGAGAAKPRPGSPAAAHAGKQAEAEAGGAGAAVRSAVMERPCCLMAEPLAVKQIGKGFAAHWYNKRVLDVYDGSGAVTSRSHLLKQLPQQPGLHLWVVKPPRSSQWVPVHLAAADNLAAALASYLHPDASVGPSGCKQRVLLDLQCRGFSIQVRYRPLKQGCSTVQQDLLCKLQQFDFPLNDVDNGGCRPIELANGWSVHDYPLMVKPMMELFEQLFGPPHLLMKTIFCSLTDSFTSPAQQIACQLQATPARSPGCGTVKNCTVLECSWVGSSNCRPCPE